MKCTGLVALLTLAGVRVAASAPATQCVVHGNDVTVENITVNGFTVGVSHVKASATMTSDRPEVTLDIDGAIAFRGTTTGLWYTVGTESMSGGGLVTMSPGAHLIGERLDGTDISGRAVVYAMDNLEGDGKPADEAVGAVSVPCDHLTLDWSHDPVRPPGPTGKGWRSKGDSLAFHTAPKASAPSVTYKAGTCEDGCLTVQGNAAKAGYRMVGTVNESVAIVGWVKASELRRIPETEAFGHSYMCTGDHGPQRMMFSAPGDPLPSHAKLAVGTKIFDQPKGAAWATVTREVELEVTFKKGDAWARIQHLPGFEGEEGHAFVPVSALISGTTR